MNNTSVWTRIIHLSANPLTWLEKNFAHTVGLCSLGLILLVSCGAIRPESAIVTVELTSLPTTPTALSSAQPASLLIVTPPPVRAEEPLTGASSRAPSIFAGVETYTPVQAALTTAAASAWPAATIVEAVRAVVQIRRCDAFGCDTPAGSGVIIHPNGLILTAFHVLLTDPNDPNSNRYTDFVIATVKDPSTAPQPRFRARLVAAKDEQDLAVLAIDRDAGDQPLDPRSLQLPALPLADVTTLFGAELHVLGFPVSGGEAISYVRAGFVGFDDGGRLIVIDKSLEPGNSGGPALVAGDDGYAIAGLVIRRRSSQNSLGLQGLLRTIDQLNGLNWTPKAPRAWVEGVQVISDGNILHFSLLLNAFDLVDEPLRLFFYVTDPANGQPWQPADFGAPLVVWADVTPQQVIERQALTLTVPLDELGAQPERLRFHPLLWDIALGNTRWEAIAEGVAVTSSPVAVAAIVTPTETPTTVATATPSPTATPTANAPATQTADAKQFAAALAATLAARFTPTPTVSVTPDFEQRLATAVAATLTAEVTPVPTDSFTPTQAQKTQPTATQPPTVTETPMPEEILCEEEEPNDTIEDASGPLAGGVECVGYPDTWDFFYFALTEGGRVTIDLENYVGADAELALYADPRRLPLVVDRNPPYQINRTLESGNYYIALYNPSGVSGVVPYVLRIEYPAELAPATATSSPTHTASATPDQAGAIPKPGATRSVTLAPGVDAVFVYVPDGPFLMGSPEGEGNEDEHPQHEVTLDAFWIMQTEVTNTQFRAFAADGGYADETLWTEDGWAWRSKNNITQPKYWDDAPWNEPEHPVVGVSWYEGVAFANWLGGKTGLSIRLPTEAEWEKAARGAAGSMYPWGDEAPNEQLLNYNDHVGSTTIVGSYLNGASPYGAFDMAGNGYEWVTDWYAAQYYANSAASNPPGPSTGDARVVRGGSWHSEPDRVRAAYRSWYPPHSRYRGVALRLVWSPLPD